MMTDAKLKKRDEGRNIGQELLAAAQEMAAGCSPLRHHSATRPRRYAGGEPCVGSWYSRRRVNATAMRAGARYNGNTISFMIRSVSTSILMIF